MSDILKLSINAMNVTIFDMLLLPSPENARLKCYFLIESF